MRNISMRKEDLSSLKQRSELWEVKRLIDISYKEVRSLEEGGDYFLGENTDKSGIVRPIDSSPDYESASHPSQIYQSGSTTSSRDTTPPKGGSSYLFENHNRGNSFSVKKKGGRRVYKSRDPPLKKESHRSEVDKNLIFKEGVSYDRRLAERHRVKGHVFPHHRQ